MSFAVKLKILLLIVVAFIVAGLSYMKLTELTKETTIVIAERDISEKDWIDIGDLKEVGIKQREKDLLASNSFSSIDEMQKAVSKVKIKKGSFIKKEDVIYGTEKWLLENGVVDQNNEVNQVYFMEDNKRLIAVKVDSEGTVGNKIKSGDYVDVIVTANIKGVDMSNTFLQHIKVNNVLKIDEGMSDSPQNITLEVKPQEANELALAKRTGKIDLVLNTTSGINENVGTTDLYRLFNMKQNSNQKN